MFVIHGAREQLLDSLPKAGRVAEIGVFTGDFSQRIYDQTSPMELHLIDPWSFQDDEDYKADFSNVQQEEANKNYEIVRERFSSQIEAEVVKIHRDYSENAVSDFPDEFFDWIYIDANHTYDACLKDLRLYAPKVKQDGFICGHDYANHVRAQEMRFGVVEAVNQFVRESGFDLSLLTFESYPTYVISKTTDHKRHERVISQAVFDCGVYTEIVNAAEKNFQQQVFDHPNGKKRLFYTFE